MRTSVRRERLGAQAVHLGRDTAAAAPERQWKRRLSDGDLSVGNRCTPDACRVEAVQAIER
jgi:hypothetical protein